MTTVPPPAAPATAPDPPATPPPSFWKNLLRELAFGIPLFLLGYYLGNSPTKPYPPAPELGAIGTLEATAGTDPQGAPHTFYTLHVPWLGREEMARLPVAFLPHATFSGKLPPPGETRLVKLHGALMFDHDRGPVLWGTQAELVADEMKTP